MSIKVENSVELDEIASSTKPSDLDLQCFTNWINQGLAGHGLREIHGVSLVDR